MLRNAEHGEPSGGRQGSPAEPDPSPTDAPRRQAAITNIKIHHIETVPMTPAQYERAVQALAALFARYLWPSPAEETHANRRGDGSGD